MMTPLVIEPRFCGPPDSGNGGYVCGLIAGRLGGQAEITLRAPPPLATPMTVESGAGDSVRVLHGRTLVAEGTRLPVSLDVDLPTGSGRRSRRRWRQVTAADPPRRTSVSVLPRMAASCSPAPHCSQPPDR